jgi:hypothetical protein
MFTEHDWAINSCRSTIQVDQSGMLRHVMQVHPVAKQQDGGQILIDFPDVFNKLVTRRRCCRCCSQTLPSHCVVKHTHNHTVDEQDSPCHMLLRLTSCSSPPAGAATASSRTRCLPPCCARWALTCTPRRRGCTPLARSPHTPMRSGHTESACLKHAEWSRAFEPTCTYKWPSQNTLRFPNYRCRSMALITSSLWCAPRRECMSLPSMHTCTLQKG